MKILAIATLLSIAAFASQQRSATSLIDSSQAGSSVVLSGTVTSTDEAIKGWLQYSFEVNVSLTNASRKGILLIVVKMDITGLNGLGTHHTRSTDYFFTSDIFYPDTIETIYETVGPLAELQGQTEAQSEGPTANAKVAFVQFLDGSTWGDQSEGRDALQQRRETWNELRFLRQTYDSQGEKRFLDALMRPSRLPGIDLLQSVYKRSSNDAEAVVRKLTDMLNFADLHQRRDANLDSGGK